MTGLRRRTTLEGQSLPVELARTLEAQVRALDLKSLARLGRGAAKGADRFQYNVVLELDGKSTELSISETEMPDELRRCVHLVTEHGKSEPA